MKRNVTKQPKLHIKKGDTVKVISGESKGKKGRVLSISPAEGRAYVEGVNLVKRHLKANVDKANPNGGIIEKEASIHVSNLAVVDEKGNATKVGRKANEAGKLQRYSKKTGQFLTEPSK